MSPVKCHISPVTCHLTATLCSLSCYKSPRRLVHAAAGGLVIDQGRTSSTRSLDFEKDIFWQEHNLCQTKFDQQKRVNCHINWKKYGKFPKNSQKAMKIAKIIAYLHPKSARSPKHTVFKSIAFILPHQLKFYTIIVCTFIPFSVSVEVPIHLQK